MDSVRQHSGQKGSPFTFIMTELKFINRPNLSGIMECKATEWKAFSSLEAV